MSPAPPDDELDELIAFLSDGRPEVKQAAAEAVQGLTGSPEGISQLAGRAERLLPPLFRLVGGRAAAARAALTALVNLSQEPHIQAALLELNAVARCMDYLRERAADPDVLVMLLANLTSEEAGAEALLGLGGGPAEGLHVAVLLKLFLDPVPAAGGRDAYEHVATVLPNVTRFQAGRRLLLEPGRGLLGALASQLRSRSELRRRGCAGAIKNCCFAAEEDGTVDDIIAETEALTTVLDVLTAREEGITAKEEDGAVREALAEAVLCLARVDAARKVLWTCNAPSLLQRGYELEEHPGVCQAMEATAELFLSDGFQPEEEGGEGGGSGAAGDVGLATGAASIEEVD